MDLGTGLASPKDLVRNPLGLIGLFTILVYGLATVSFTLQHGCQAHNGG
jgi:hypothetical protein